MYKKWHMSSWDQIRLWNLTWYTLPTDIFLEACEGVQLIISTVKSSPTVSHCDFFDETSQNSPTALVCNMHRHMYTSSYFFHMHTWKANPSFNSSGLCILLNVLMSLQVPKSRKKKNGFQVCYTTRIQLRCSLKQGMVPKIGTPLAPGPGLYMIQVWQAPPHPPAM